MIICKALAWLTKGGSEEKLIVVGFTEKDVVELVAGNSLSKPVDLRECGFTGSISFFFGADNNDLIERIRKTSPDVPVNRGGLN